MEHTWSEVFPIYLVENKVDLLSEEPLEMQESLEQSFKEFA
jgi:hypothetical protein